VASRVGGEGGGERWVRAGPPEFRARGGGGKLGMGKCYGGVVERRGVRVSGGGRGGERWGEGGWGRRSHEKGRVGV